MEQSGKYDVIVIGGGPAGLTAGIYLSRARLSTLILNIGVAGGQMILTHEIANYPGIESISGYKLASTMKQQALSFGATIKTISNPPQIIDKGDYKIVQAGENSFSAHSVILATGGSPRMLGVKGEQQFKGLGISYCATCDGEFFTGKNIVVVGGGNSALEEAVSLSRFAETVTIVHQFDHFQAFPAYIDEAKNNPKIKFIMETEIREFAGSDKLEKVLLHNRKNDSEEWLNIDGAFIFIGYQPNNMFVKDLITLNDRDEIIVNEDMETSVKGIYAAGDNIAKKYRQVTTAVGEATIAALAAAARTWELKKKN